MPVVLLFSAAVSSSDAEELLEIVADGPDSGFVKADATVTQKEIEISAVFPSEGKGIGARLQIRHSVNSPEHIWLPNLAPDPGIVIGDHAFRSPAFIFANQQVAVALVPDIDDLAAVHRSGLRVWADYDHPSQLLTVAFGDYRNGPHHRCYTPTEVDYRGQRVRLRLMVLASTKQEDIDNPYRMVNEWLWARWGRAGYRNGGSQLAPFRQYAKHVTNWTFKPHPDGWGDTVWQSFNVDGRECGAPAFIVNVGQHASVPYDERIWRSPRAVWNQAWFSTQRCANGILRYARQIGSDDLEERAHLMTQFALAAPQKDGLFPAVYSTGGPRGQLYKDAAGWDKAFWTNSDRRPPDASGEAYHIVDASFTARLLLEWDHLVSGDPEVREYVLSYVNRLLKLQRPNGAFPGWVEPDGTLVPTLLEGPESAMSVALLLQLARSLPNHKDKAVWTASAEKAVKYLISGPIGEGRWEDFETYFSCSKWGTPGERVSRNGVYKSNTLSMFWCAEALLLGYKQFGSEQYLKAGLRCIDEMSLYQQVWSPKYIAARCHGGFGVMNFDAEWNDARQSLFAPLYLEYYKATGRREYFERGVSALRASFAMLYCPENDAVRKEYEQAFPLFGSESYGFMMENICHGGPYGNHIGSFTIFTWGNGAALATSALVRDLYGDVFIDSKRLNAFGIDGCSAIYDGEIVTVQDRYNRSELRVVYDSGESVQLKLDENGRGIISPDLDAVVDASH